ncbi:hypothetical protein IMSAG192_00943 [Muribaculaceae bacterium]|nr:hypothetical protein IMSAG192_00943 [Muribaculaceae bacterium]
MCLHASEAVAQYMTTAPSMRFSYLPAGTISQSRGSLYSEIDTVNLNCLNILMGKPNSVNLSYDIVMP